MSVNKAWYILYEVLSNDLTKTTKNSPQCDLFFKANCSDNIFLHWSCERATFCTNIKYIKMWLYIFTSENDKNLIHVKVKQLFCKSLHLILSNSLQLIYKTFKTTIKCTIAQFNALRDFGAKASLSLGFDHHLTEAKVSFSQFDPINAITETTRLQLN